MSDAPTPPSPESPRPPGWRQAPLVRVLISQALGAVIAFSASLIATRFTGFVVPLLAVLAAQGLFAAWVGHKLALPRWWIPVQIIMPPGAAYAAAFAIPGWVYLLIFGVLVLVYWNAISGRVPLYLTNAKTWAALESLLADRNRILFIDIGCGTGGTLLHLARARPNDRFIGIESAPLTFAFVWLRRRFSGLGNIDLIYGDFWNRSLAPYDVVYAFLSPAPMPALIEKARQEMQPGAVLISNSFTAPEWPPDETMEVSDRRRTQLHLWRIKAGS